MLVLYSYVSYVLFHVTNKSAQENVFMSRDEQDDLLKPIVILCKDFFIHMHIRCTKPLSAPAIALSFQNSAHCFALKSTHGVLFLLALPLIYLACF